MWLARLVRRVSLARLDAASKAGEEKKGQILHHFGDVLMFSETKVLKLETPQVIFFLVHLARHFAIMRTRPNSFVSI